MSNSDVETSELLSSKIHFGHGPLTEISVLLHEYLSEEKKIFLLTDENTHRHCLPLLRPFLPEIPPEYILPPGEKSKSMEYAGKIWSWLLGLDAGRDDLLINLGGGMVTDLGGFAASVYKRGMDTVNIPTSLIGQVDASIGGKTAVNLNDTKNQIGSFHFPVAVYIDPEFLKTLPEDHLRSGYAEILKGALLSGEKQWKLARDLDYEDVESLEPAIRESVRFKTKVAGSDPYDRSRRRALNFGHTLGHALESCSAMQYPPGMLHGDAVAWGMAGEIFISYRMGRISWSDLSEINTCLEGTFPPPRLGQKDKSSIHDAMLKDKKNFSGRVMISTLKKIGEPLLNLECDSDAVDGAIDYVLKPSRHE